MDHIDHFAELIFVLCLIVISLFKRNKDRLDVYLIIYLSLECSGLVFGILGGQVLKILSSNLVQFAISQILIVAVVAKMILNDIGSSRKILWSPLLVSVCFLFFCFVPVSLSDLLNVNFPPTVRSWFTYLQYYDFTTFTSIVIIVNVFFWLYHIIRDSRLEADEVNRRYLIILSILLFYGGTFFMLGFSRLLLEDLAAFREFMKTYYRPIYLSSYVIITLAVRWKSVRSLFSGHSLS